MTELSVLSVFWSTADGKFYVRAPDGTLQVIGDTLGGGSESTTASNVVGAGIGVLYDQTGAALTFVRINNGSGILIDATDGVLTISASGGGGGGGAPTNVSYVTLGDDPTLTAERILNTVAPITLTDFGAGDNVTIGFATPGSNTYVMFNDSGALGAHSGLAYAKLSAALTVGSLVQAPKMQRSSTRVAFDTTASNLYLGSDSSLGNQFSATYLYGGNLVSIGLVTSSAIDITTTSTTLRRAGSSDGVVVTASAIQMGLPVGGASGGAPLIWDVATVTLSGSTSNLSNAAQRCPMLNFTGSPSAGHTVHALEDTGALWYVSNDTAVTINFVPYGAGTGVAISAGRKAIIACRTGVNFESF